MYAFNSAAIFLPGHPYIESTTILSDIIEVFQNQVRYMTILEGCSASVAS